MKIAKRKINQVIRCFRKRTQNHLKTLSLVVICLVIFQSLNLVSTFSDVHVNAQGQLLAVEAEVVNVGDEVILVLTRSTEEAETIVLTLPEGMVLHADKTEESLSDTTEFIYVKDMKQVEVSYEEGNSDSEVKLHVSCEVAGTYVISVTSNNGISEELEFIVNEATADSQVPEGQNDNQTTSKEESEPGDNQTTSEEEEPSDNQTTSEEEQEPSDNQTTSEEEQEPSDNQATSEEEQEPSDNQATSEEEQKTNDNQTAKQNQSTRADVYGIAEVNDQNSFIAALQDKTVSVINITNNFMLNFSNTQLDYTNYIRPELVINGNGHTVDFRGFSSEFIVSASNPMSITLKNITIYGTNYYGPIRLSGTSGYGKIRYENVEYYGAQLTASANADLTFAGNIICEQKTSYISPIDSSNRSTQANNQANFEARNLTIEAGAKYVGKTVNSGAWDLSSGGVATIHEGAIVELTAPGTLGEANGHTIYAQGGLNIKNGAQLHIYNEDRAAIRVEDGANIDVGAGAQLNVKITKNLLFHPGIYLPSGSNLNIGQEAEVKVALINQGDSAFDAIHGEGTNKIMIGKQATFDVIISGGYGVRDVIEFGGGNNIIQFADAKRVNIQLENASYLSRLIDMGPSGGNLKADCQEVRLWTSQTWSSGKDDKATYSWKPIFGMVATYSESGVTAVEASSLLQSVADDFKKKFKEENQYSWVGSSKRMLFLAVADVEVSLNELTNNTSKSNSYTITGKATPGAYIYLSGNDYIPAGTIKGQADNDTTLYHAIADASGNFSVTLTAGHYFNAGEVITAHAFLNGKEAVATTIVKDENGHLSLIVPETLSFGIDNQLPYKSTRIYRENTDWAIQIVDTRYTKSEWQLTAKLTSDFIAENGATLEDLLVLATGTSESDENPLSSTPIVIAQDTVASNETTRNVSWSKEKGLLLRLLPGEAQVAKYTNTVEWTLGDVPSNP